MAVGYDASFPKPDRGLRLARLIGRVIRLFSTLLAILVITSALGLGFLGLIGRFHWNLTCSQDVCVFVWTFNETPPAVYR